MICAMPLPSVIVILIRYRIANSSSILTQTSVRASDNKSARVSETLVPNCKGDPGLAVSSILLFLAEVSHKHLKIDCGNLK